ncbi:MAG TPA: hypothetical protein VMT66_03415 [Steroidobacteraceae bacterium]|nr:hypothetical protein [Steroidobacteraceae bacterium]
MAASERRTAVWPWLVMPVVVLLVFYALHRVQHPPPKPAMPAPAVAAPDDSPRQ